MKINFAFFGIALTCLLWLCNCNSSPNLNGWEKLNIPCNGEFTPHTLGINSNGVMLIAGYDDERKSCGMVNFFECSPYKIFRSFDNGKTWQLLRNIEINERHAFVKGDKANPDLLPHLVKRYGQVLRIGKKVFDVVNYADYNNKGRLFADGKDFYLYIDFLLYNSVDNGTTWQEMEIVDRSLPLPTDNASTICFKDSFLFVHESSTLQKLAFYKQNNKFYPVTTNNFAILNKPSNQKKVIGDGKNLAANYSRDLKDSKNIMRRNGTVSTDGYGVAEFYVPNKKIIIGNFVVYAEKGDILSNFAIVSKDNGKTFSPENLPKNLPIGFSAIKAIGYFKGNPVLSIQIGEVNADKFGAGAYSVSETWLWNLSKNKLEPLPLPNLSVIMNNVGFIFGFESTPEFAYYYTIKGLYRIKNK